ncbi:MAG: thermosome subunit alpha [Halodesulfurarchaeum sp.]
MRGRPMIVLDEESDRRKGSDARSHNVAAARAVAQAVRSTLGPKGMDKMLVSDVGDVTVTNDGVTVLEGMDVQNPTAQMVIEVAQTQEDEAGDGTTTAVAVAGELLNNAETLLEEDIHPARIVRGFDMAAKRAREEIEAIAREVEPDDAVLESVAATSMTGKGAESELELLSALVLEAVRNATVDGTIDLERIEIKTEPGQSIGDSRLIDGTIVDQDPTHEAMPTDLADASTLLVETPITINQIEADATLSVDDPSQLQQFVEREQQELRTMAEQLADAGVDAIVSSKTIDDAVGHLLAKEGILAVEHVKSSDVETMADSLDVDPVSDPDFETLSGADLATADVTYEGHDGWFVVEGEGHGATILLRGATRHVTDELERGVADALGVVAATVTDGRVLAGGGAIEVELADRLRDYADGVEGREQLAVEAFADALEVVPRMLAENAGLDPIDALVDLRSAHERGDAHAGLDVFSGAVLDTYDAGVVEPAHAKAEAVSNAARVANLVLRIDDVISATALGEDYEDEDDQGAGQGGMGGMGGMM